MSNQNIIDKKDLLDIANSVLPNGRQIPVEKSEALMDLFTTINESIDSSNKEKFFENIKNAKDWLNVSKQNLKSSRILYSNKQFSDSVSALQQSVEKLVKAYGLAFFAFTPKQLSQNISHDTPMAFVEMIKTKWVSPLIDVLRQFNKTLDTDTSDLEKVIKKKRKELASLDEKEINYVLNLITLTDKRLQSKEPQIKAGVNKIINNLKKELGEFEVLNDLMVFFEEQFNIRLVSSLIGLYLISVATYAHWNYSRYPDKEIKPKHYDESMGIVKKSPELHNWLDNAVIALENYLNSYDSKNKPNQDADL